MNKPVKTDLLNSFRIHLELFINYDSVDSYLELAFY